jgi:hypothetical protein
MPAKKKKREARAAVAGSPESLPIGNRGSGSSTAQPLQASAQSWRDVLPVHPAAELFPLMSEPELKELGEDIKKNGLTSPIVLWQADPKAPEQLLDGRNRLDAIEMMTGCQVIVGPPSFMAGEDFLACEKVIVLDKSVDPYAYVISANIHRRHLTGEQKRDLIGKLLKATPEKSNRQIAETVKASPTTVGTVRAEMEVTSDVSKLDTRTDTKGRKQPVSKSKPKPVKEIALGKVAPPPPVEKLECADSVAQPQSAADIDPDSTGEIERLNARIAELENQNRLLESKIKPSGARALMASRQEPTDSLDYFPTPPFATRALIERVLPVLAIRQSDLANMTAWEPACGEGHMAEPLAEYFGRVIATDIHEYGYGEAPVDFLSEGTSRDADWCITNPPFDDNKAVRFVRRALKLARVGTAMFVRLQCLETVERYELVFRDHPPTLVSFFVERVNLCKGR